MFCPSNETLLSLTEKTKLLAQKCTQQIRAQSGLSPMRRETAVFHLPTPPSGAAVAAEMDANSSATETGNSVAQKDLLDIGGETRTADDEDVGGGLAASLNCFTGRGGAVKNQHHCLHSRKQSTAGGCSGSSVATESHVGPKERTTKWYVKVIQIAKQKVIPKRCF